MPLSPSPSSPHDRLGALREAVHRFLDAPDADDRQRALDAIRDAARRAGTDAFDDASLELPPDATALDQAEIYFAIADGLGADLDPEPTAFDAVGLDEEARFGERFALFAEAVPAPPGSPVAGLDGLVHVLRQTAAAAPSEDGVQALRESPATRAAQVRAASPLGQTHPDAVVHVGDRLAEFGLSPLSFLGAAQAVGHLLRLADRDGDLAPDRSVTFDARGHLVAGWAGDPDDAHRMVREATGLPTGLARTVLVWLLTASEASEHLFEGCLAVPSALGDERHVTLSLLADDQADETTDDPLLAWRAHPLHVPDGSPALQPGG